MPSEIHKVGVIGIGLMGSGIAQVAATRGFETLVVDVTRQIVERGMARIRDGLDRLARSYEKSGGKTGTAASETGQILSRLRVSTKREELLQCDILIEAIVENEEAKKETIASLSAMGYQKLFVSNTSSISITRLANAYAYPDRFMGMHFMNPVPVQPGCELTRGFLTSNDTWARITAFCRELGKEPIFAEDKAGFGINRMFVPFLMEAVKVVEEGIMSCEDADKTTLCLGHKMGPIATLDFVGLDTTLAIADVLENELGPSYRAPDLLRKLVAAGCHGMKNGKGFYLWEQGKKVKVNPAVERYHRKQI
ncbi:MAG TPA: 3-hydroxyacyl-CoA dehydrogenase NAD-binding domain-containing protein [Candidatus Binatia bacterium]|nr:3-hydroxyacyl-CoA dehydrogenase NAD-binding domain-containing protein [Candidatus Binatia bacterium]